MRAVLNNVGKLLKRFVDEFHKKWPGISIECCFVLVRCSISCEIQALYVQIYSYRVGIVIFVVIFTDDGHWRG